MDSPSRSSSVARYSSLGVLQQGLELPDLLFLVRRDHVERLEVVVDVDAEAGPRLALVGRRDVGGACGQVPDVADEELDGVVAPEEAGDRLGLGRALDDDKWFRHSVFSRLCGTEAKSQPHLCRSGSDGAVSPDTMTLP